MSRILEIIRSKKFVLIGVGLILLSIILAFATNNFWFLFFSVFGIVICCLFVASLIDNKVSNIIKEQCKIFGASSKVRNVDCLIIGDMIDASSCVNKDETFIQISDANRGFLSDYEIIRHTHSILKDEGGIIYIPYKKKNINNDFIFFDYPFFHTITLNKYDLKNKVKELKHPFFYHPVLSLKKLFGRKNKKGVFRILVDKRIDEFCAERGYVVKYIEIK